MPSLPVLQALLLADQVYQDRNTGKYVICGIFSAIFFTPKESTSEEKSLDSSASPGEADLDENSQGGGNAAARGGKLGGGAGHEEATPPEQPPKPAPVPLSRLVKAGSPYAYISMTELQGSRRFELRYVDLVENNVLFSTTFDVACRDPLETIQITVPLPPLPIPHEGAFVVELLCDGELLGSHRVIAKKQQKP